MILHNPRIDDLVTDDLIDLDLSDDDLDLLNYDFGDDD